MHLQIAPGPYLLLAFGRYFEIELTRSALFLRFPFVGECFYRSGGWGWEWWPWASLHNESGELKGTGSW